MWRGNWLPYSRFVREVDESFSGGGINLRCIELMRSWNLTFNGIVKNLQTQQELQVRPKVKLLSGNFFRKNLLLCKANFDLKWSSDEQILLFDEAFPVSATSKAFAKEPWNAQFFQDLKKYVMPERLIHRHPPSPNLTKKLENCKLTYLI